LRAFSQSHAEVLKAECGGPLESYFQRGHWRMVMPFSRREQEKMAGQFLAHVKENQPVVAHVCRFPSLGINHALVLFDAEETTTGIEFRAYDPNSPEAPTTLSFDRAQRTFVLPANHYFPGGRLDAYEVYHKWDY
jgi:hypothetical protein